MKFEEARTSLTRICLSLLPLATTLFDQAQTLTLFKWPAIVRTRCCL